MMASRREEQPSRPLTASEEGFTATLTRCCAKNAEFTGACAA